MVSPFAPHMAEELWEKLGHRGGIVAAGWPVFDPEVAKAAEIVVPVQVNGKVRARITVDAEESEERLRELALADPQVAKHLEGKTVRKVVVAGSGPNRLDQYRGELMRHSARRRSSAGAACSCSR